MACSSAPQYMLAAYDNSGRRYWLSFTIDFASAPAPVGAWNVSTLTQISEWDSSEQIPPQDLVAWYRAGDLDLRDGSTIATWPDRSCYRADLLTIPSVDQPLFVASDPDFNGQASVQFGGNRQLYRLLPPGYQSGSRGVSLYIVHRPTLTGPGLQCLFCWGQDNAATRRMTALVADLGGGIWQIWSDSYSQGTAQYQVQSATQIYSVFVGDGQPIANGVVWIDGAVPPVQTSPGNGVALNIPSPVSEVKIGGFAQANGYVFGGKIAEVIVYSKDHTLTERARTLAYLSDRYNIAVP